VVDISSALTSFLESRASFGGTILITDIEAVMTNVTGVQSVKINVLSRTPAQQVVDITLTAREYAVLASSNPLLTVSLASNPTQTLSTNSV
jgi:copper chaperone CopZ